jgi:hypothetical protein
MTQAEINSAPVKISLNPDLNPLAQSLDPLILSCKFPEYCSPVDIYIAFVGPAGRAYFPDLNGLLGTNLDTYGANTIGNISYTFDNNGYVLKKGAWQIYWLIQPTGGNWSAYEFGGYQIRIE